MGTRINLHASVVVACLAGAAPAGVLILGPSGAGKSSLALRIIEMLRGQGGFAALVADDRVWVEAVNGRLVAEVPQPIAGLVEIRGFGPSRIGYETRTILDYAVRLIPRDAAPRLAAEDTVETILDVALPRLDLAEREAEGAARAVLAWLAGRAIDGN